MFQSKDTEWQTGLKKNKTHIYMKSVCIFTVCLLTNNEGLEKLAHQKEKKKVSLSNFHAFVKKTDFGIRGKKNLMAKQPA